MSDEKQCEKISLETVKKYLCCKVADEKFISLYEQVKKEVVALSQPKRLCVLCNATKKNGYYFLENLNLTIESEDINKLFVSCDGIVVMAVTLGLALDRQIAFYAKCDIMRSAMMDAVASVYVEDIMDELQEEFLKNYPNKQHTMRFSVGYGDLPLSLQKPLIDAINGQKLLGISVNENYMMTPLKSITAFLGLSDVKQVKSSACLLCKLKDNCTTKCSKCD